MNEYSAAEEKLIGKLSAHWLNLIQTHSFNPTHVYTTLALEAFTENRQGPEVDCLRNVVKAISQCNPYRITPEFDALCTWEE